MNQAMAAPVEYRGWPALTLKNAFASMVVIPELGGKIVSLSSVATATEFLWQDRTRPYRTAVYGDAFGDYDASGFDECFPSIGECDYPTFPWQGSAVPDHGELWCVPWHYELAGAATIYLHTYGVRFPYHFEKWITLAENETRYTLRYRVTNLSRFDFAGLWSAHPLFAAEVDMRILLPGTPRMRLNHVIGDRIRGEILQEYTWPWLPGPSGKPVDYRLIGTPDLHANDKVFVDAPVEGWCALYRPHSGEFVGLTFAPGEVPFIGVCVNHGGWPFTGARGFWVAIEPCTGWPDRLDQAVAQGTYATLRASMSMEWSIGLQLGRVDAAEEVNRLLGTVSSAD